MTVKKLHTSTKIFFPDPYVVRIEYKETAAFEADNAYRNLVRRTYKTIKGTWGHSTLTHETIYTKTGEETTAVANNPFAAIFNGGIDIVRRGYFCFKDEMDVLQFRLSLDTTAIQVVMWPNEISFTIHEVVEADES